MITEKQQLDLQSLLDGELPAGQEVDVYKLLAENEEARKLYRSLVELKKLARCDWEELPHDSVLSQLFSERKRVARGMKHAIHWVSVTAAAVLLIFSVYLLSQNVRNAEVIEMQSRALSQQHEKMELLQTNYGYPIVSVIDSLHYLVVKTAKM